MNIPVLDFKLGVKGKFKLEVHKNGGDKRTVAEFDNLITNTGLDRVASGSVSLINVCAVGTGNTTPTFSDTLLASYLASQAVTSTSFTNSGSPSYNVRAVYVYAFGQGAAAGNLSEIGITFTPGSTSTLTSRALILDSFGNPTTLTVLSDEFLTVTYTFTIAPDLTDVTQTLSGYTFTIRPALVNTSSTSGNIGTWSATGGLGTIGNNSLNRIHNGAIGTVISSPAGSSIDCTSQTLNTYVIGTYTRTMTIIWAPASGAMVVSSFYLGFNGPKYQASISPTINKTTGQSITLVFRLTVVRA